MMSKRGITTAGVDVQVDDRQFLAALQTYLELTSKTREEALTGKMRDLCWHAAKYTPIMPAGIRGFARFGNARAVAVARLQKSGQAVDDSAVKKELKRLAHPARAYMKSGYALAGQMIARTPASTAGEDVAAKQATKRYKQVVASVTKATSGDIFHIAAQIRWSANRMPNDVAGKEYIARRALEEARTVVGHDMLRYIGGKLREHAARVSAR